MLANAKLIHERLRNELEVYIKSQYLGKSKLLLNALADQLDEEGTLYRAPFVESTPAYKSVQNGIHTLRLPDWLKAFFIDLAEKGMGVYPAPFQHQLDALQNAYHGRDLFVATGTGSGKTECFMWPMLSKMCVEAREHPETWKVRGVRAIVMYPMNALVSDQISRLRRLMGDPGDRFVGSFRNTAGQDVRRPQFGMYTGRTPYPGSAPTATEDKKLAKSLSKMVRPTDERVLKFYNELLQDGKIPAKCDLSEFVNLLAIGRHATHPDDAELITRFEMQQTCPDILITNYSMLQYMLFRHREAKIWEDTREWLECRKENKLLFVIDEAHMYRGSAGGEVALLIRRFFDKLGINRDKVQFILTTASMPNSNEADRAAVRNFAKNLTASTEYNFVYLTGEEADLPEETGYTIPDESFLTFSVSGEETENNELLGKLNAFWSNAKPAPDAFDNWDNAHTWLYHNLANYTQFHILLGECCRRAHSVDELAENIFAAFGKDKAKAMEATYNLLVIASLAKDEKGRLLFPIRLHLLFRGLQGIYSCANPKCKHASSAGGLTLGRIFTRNGIFTCPDCGGAVYELINDRRCGALFFRGYIQKKERIEGKTFLWRAPGVFFNEKMIELHLLIPEEGRTYSGSTKYPVKPCYLDTQSGFINFEDDSWAGKDDVIKLYFRDCTEKGKPNINTFATCPHCRHLLDRRELTSFSTRGNQSFYNLVKAQFNLQPPVAQKSNDPMRYPNQGRKVLLFSDSRQRAAKLARDMSQASDDQAVMQLFILAVKAMEDSGKDLSLNNVYGYFVLEAAKRNVLLFHDEEADQDKLEGDIKVHGSRSKFREDCQQMKHSMVRKLKRGKVFEPELTFDNAPPMMLEHLIHLFCGRYNTIYDTALGWLEPRFKNLEDAQEILEENGVEVSDVELIEVFNAWLLDICNPYGALGHRISDERRKEVIASYKGYGLPQDWKFSDVMRKNMGWDQAPSEMGKWRKAFAVFLDSNDGKYFIELSRIVPKLGLHHQWLRCKQCSELTAFSVRRQCPTCGCADLEAIDEQGYSAMDFWRKPVVDAIEGEAIRVIDTEEHTAQLSYKDQRDEMWSRTEQYEMRFQDLLDEDESSVDILSSTTTMEVGIDIGSLVAVGLRNIPPMRENYQQRAGRAGRRGASMSTIVTFCEDGPHDTMYFADPAPMFRGEPRRPWIDIQSEKLLRRHIGITAIQGFLTDKKSMDTIGTIEFFDSYWDLFMNYLETFELGKDTVLLQRYTKNFILAFRRQLQEEMALLNEKRQKHPELYSGQNKLTRKTLLDALYEEGIIPTYSFPKNVVSTFIANEQGQLQYEVDRGLDVAISEYAPGRSIVVDKKTYQIGGLYYHGSERMKGAAMTPARSFVEDPNYRKTVFSCKSCGWLGPEDDLKDGHCPFCENTHIIQMLPMVKPWGFAPVNGKSTAPAQLVEAYSYADAPLYSTLPDADGLIKIPECSNIRMAKRSDQRIIMINKGPGEKGFMICPDCGAAISGDDPHGFSSERIKIGCPFYSRYPKSECNHSNAINTTLGFDFVTDMLVLEIKLDKTKMNISKAENPWLDRAARSLAEALRLQTSRLLDVEFTELNAGYRLREHRDEAYVDVFLYDSLSSGAGYSSGIADQIEILLQNTRTFLAGCKCENACQDCLKHYRNQNYHFVLDRFAAIELLDWCKNKKLADELTVGEQIALVHPLEKILRTYGISVRTSAKGIFVKKDAKEIGLKVYPMMWVKPRTEAGFIWLNNFEMKYARPIAIDIICEQFSLSN
jgi:ATP-dependent helicase YprA (DUF1998 family)